MHSSHALVLLVDDVSEIVEELLTFMGLHGISALGVFDLDQAIQALEQNVSIGVLACDVRLGRESGLAIVSRIREHDQLRDRQFRYLFISGDPIHDAFPADMPEHQVLTKPVQPQILIEVLRDLLDDAVPSLTAGGGQR